jgi:hypothetical protein
MPGKRVGGILSAVALLVALAANVGPAAGTIAGALDFLWPVGVILTLLFACAVLGLLLWAKWNAPTDSRELPGDEIGEPSAGNGSVRPFEPNGHRREREAANAVMLTASEAYINARRNEAAVCGDEDPDLLRRLAAAVKLADRNFVTARQRLEQYGSESVLEATLDVEAAVKRNELELADQLRRDYLVPAVRQEMEHLLVPRA